MKQPSLSECKPNLKNMKESVSKPQSVDRILSKSKKFEKLWLQLSVCLENTFKSSVKYQRRDLCKQVHHQYSCKYFKKPYKKPGLMEDKGKPLP